MKKYVTSWIRGMAFAALLMTLTATAAIAQDMLTVASPDGRNKVGVAVNEGKLYYTLSRDGRPLLLPSMLGFEFKGAPALARWPADNRQLALDLRPNVDTALG